MPLPTLNRRHKVGLFLVLVAAGVSLLLAASAEQTVGAVVLGIAAAWAFGSLSFRTLGFLSCSLVCVTGLVILGIPVWQDWNSYRIQQGDWFSQNAPPPSAPQSAAKAPDQPGWALAPKTPTAAQLAQQPWLKYAAKPPLPPGYYDVDALPPGFQQEQLWDPVAAARAKYPGLASEPDEKILRFLSNQENFRSSFPEYAHLDDQTITRNMAKYAKPARPTFSIRGTFFSHRLSILIGLTLLVAGPIGNGLLFARLRKSRREARVLPA